MTASVAASSAGSSDDVHARPSPRRQRDLDEIFADITRREFGFGLASFVAWTALSGCADDDDSVAPAPSATPTWNFVDDRGERIELTRKPERVVVYEAFLPAFWELGLRPVAVLASTPLADNPDVTEVAERLGINLADIDVLSTTYGEVNLEALAAANPELVVTYFNTRTPVLYGYADEAMQEKATPLAPTAALDIHNSVSTDLARVLDIAVTLGADPGSSDVVAARADFDAASDRLRGIAAAKEDLKVLAAVPVPDGIFVAAPSIYTFTRYLQDLGLDVVVPRDDEATVSWELVPTELASDAVLLAAGPGYPTHEDLLKKQPTWASHPAAVADQVASAFPNVTVPSYRATARLLNEVADAIEGFDSLN